jgi:hypothetical protein
VMFFLRWAYSSSGLSTGMELSDSYRTHSMFSRMIHDYSGPSGYSPGFLFESRSWTSSGLMMLPGCVVSTTGLRYLAEWNA